MLKFALSEDKNKPLTVLCMGAHSDDIEIGCGGTLLRLIDEYPAIRFCWVVFSAIGARKDEANKAANAFAGSHRLAHLILHEFQDGFMPFNGVAVKNAFEDLKAIVTPDLIFTHQPRDAHQDHRLLSELTWNTFRNHLVLEYEIPKYDGDMGRPSAYVALTEQQRQSKVAHLMDAFGTQRSKRWFEESTFNSLMRLRGMECNSPSGYAEAFYSRKFVI